MNYAHLRLGILFFFFFCNVWDFGAAVQKLECYVDSTLDKTDPNNIYKCNLTTTCCYESGVPSCCTSKDTTVAVMEQAQLWGTLAGLIAILAILMFCCRHDGDWCCNRKDGGRYKYCCFGPLIYREGKQPLPPATMSQDDDDSLDMVDDERLKAMNMRLQQRPADAPPPYECTLPGVKPIPIQQIQNNV